MSTYRPSIATYAVSGTLAVLMSWVLTGCRFNFGNRVESPEDPDKISGYYATQAETLEFCVGGSSLPCAQLTTNLLPSDIASVMTNPVVVAMRDLETGEAVLVDSTTNRYGLPTTVYPDNSLKFVGSAPKQQAFSWSSTTLGSCTLQLLLEQEGQLMSEGSGTTDALGFPLSGRLQMTLSIYWVFGGDCDADLQLAAQCYLDDDDCGGSSAAINQERQAEAQSLFGPYVDAGAMTVADIEHATGVFYTATFR